MFVAASQDSTVSDNDDEEIEITDDLIDEITSIIIVKLDFSKISVDAANSYVNHITELFPEKQ